MMMVNLELERRLQWSRREGGSRVTVSMLCEETVSLGKKKGGRENSVEKVRSNSSCSTIYSFTTSLNLRKNFSFFRRFQMGRVSVINNEKKKMGTRVCIQSMIISARHHTR